MARLGVRRLEHRGHARREDQRAGNLHEHREPIRHVVAVVRRGEPGEVHPRPPDGEEDHQVADEAFERVGLGDGVMQPARRLRDGDDEDEVEEQLERRRGAVWLVRRARRSSAAMSRAPEAHSRDRWLTSDISGAKFYRVLHASSDGVAYAA